MGYNGTNLSLPEKENANHSPHVLREVESAISKFALPTQTAVEQDESYWYINAIWSLSFEEE